jgi:hypothetical protein
MMLKDFSLLAYGLGFFMLFSILMIAFTNIGITGGIILGIGLFFALLVPGHFFAKYLGYEGHLGIAASIVISLCFVPMSLYAWNRLIGFRITNLAIYAIILGLAVIGYVLYRMDKASASQ